ncbi:LysR family transcriptional regulator [Enterococcus malodoratus]|uniref:LysR family transcriptional regulator n=1 Tax=Enterococcus malodoratus TaxID=71451 RepID=UPI002073C5A1|nr:LysR family transcriptional regulator [Enterococcus malodoratus]
MDKYDVILEVVKTSNISQAAKNLNYSQSAISQTIKSFENEMGFPIFKRTNSGVMLLSNASSVIKSLEIIHQENLRLQQLSDAMTQSEIGTVRIGSFISFAMTYLPKILKEFTTKYPKIKFEIFTGNQQEIYEKLSRNEIDVAFTSMYGMDEFSYEVFLQDEFVVVLPCDHPFVTEPTISINRIVDETYILSGERFDFEIGSFIHSLGLEPQYTFEIFDELVALKLIEAGFGISIFSKFFLDSIPNHVDVAIRPISEHYYRSLVIAKNSDVYSSAASDIFNRFATTWLENIGEKQ